MKEYFMKETNMEMNKMKVKILFLLIMSIFFNSVSYGLENKIILKINNEIITSIDLENEINYLSALNPGVKNLNKDEIIKFSKKSIIQEKIKKIEIIKYFDNPNIPEEFLENLLQNIYFKLGIKNLDDFKKYLNLNKVDYKMVLEKIENEALWNELIFSKFKNKLRVDESKLKEKINKNKTSKSYLMSEIFFKIDQKEKIENKYKKINKIILEKGFEKAALLHSISETAKMGGELDWINENSLNEEIKKILDSKKINEHTKPITVPGGFLILKINDIKLKKLEINIQEELKKLIRETKNNQLNKFSIMYFNKIQKDLVINEI